MATTKTPADKAAKTPVDLITRVKHQLSTQVLKSKLTKDQLADLTAHINKLQALIS
jgi:hypothetical protein